MWYFINSLFFSILNLLLHLMNHLKLFCLSLLVTFIVSSSFCQTGPLFGKDIVISDQPSQQQRSVAIATAFNGWIYSAYSFYNPNNLNELTFRIMRSTDQGMTWDSVGNVGTVSWTAYIRKVELLACGTDLSNFKLFLGFIVYDTVFQAAGGAVYRLNPQTCEIEEEVLKDITFIRDLSLSWDNQFTPQGANPYSVAMLYSRYYDNDSIIFKCSDNGGMTFGIRKLVALHPRSFVKVSLSYGWSPSLNTGRYFAVWEQKQHSYSNFGHIYEAHSLSGFNSSFSQPVCIDSLESGSIDHARSPVISSQYGNYANGSLDLTTVILFEKYDSSNNIYVIQGMYNLLSTLNNTYTPFYLTSSPGSKLQADVAFNPFDSSFIITYFDSLALQLPFVVKNCNMPLPNNWTMVTEGYNDSTDLRYPRPSIGVNAQEGSGMCVWIRQGASGNGIAMFDAPYSTFTGLSQSSGKGEVVNYGIYPNPCNDKTSFWFELKHPSRVSIRLFSLQGIQTDIISDNICNEGKNLIRTDVSDLTPGCYYYQIVTNWSTLSGKIIVIR